MIAHYVRGALLGIVVFMGALCVFVWSLVSTGYAPMAADVSPSNLEAHLAMTALHATSERQMGDVKNPLPLNGDNLIAGLKIYQHNCLVCHGASDGKASMIAAGFYVPSPQFGKDGAEDDPEGATYWKIAHGIRFSAMPAFGRALDDRALWQVTMFLKHMDAMPKRVDTQWRATKADPRGGMATLPKMEMP